MQYILVSQTNSILNIVVCLHILHFSYMTQDFDTAINRVLSNKHELFMTQK